MFPSLALLSFKSVIQLYAKHCSLARLVERDCGLKIRWSHFAIRADMLLKASFYRVGSIDFGDGKRAKLGDCKLKGLGMNCVGIGSKLVAGAVLICVLATGCADQKSNMDRFSKPIFTTKPPRKTRVTPMPAPPPVQHYVHRPVQPRIQPPSGQPRQVVAEAGWIPPGGVRSRWSEIVIHHSASATGGAVAFDHHHRTVNKWDELGYHFVIGNGTDTGDGKVEVGSRWTKQKTGAHCKTSDNFYNEHGVGICLVGNFESSSPSSSQMASLDKLVLFLSQQCGLSASNVTGHGSVTHKTACPGRRFPLSAVKRNLSLAQSNLHTNMLATANTQR